MEATITLPAQLKPNLSEEEIIDLQNYFVVYEKYADDFSNAIIEDLKTHPSFSNIISAMTDEEREANNTMSLKLTRDAIFESKWDDYLNYQFMQGIVYAKMGLSFSDWYEVVALVKKYIRPKLHETYQDHKLLYSALSGMNTLMDIAMNTIGESYIKERNELLIAEGEELKKYKHFFNNSYDLAGIANADGYFVIVNKRFESLLGYSADELYKLPFISFVHPDDIDITVAEFENLKNGVNTFNFSNRYRKNNGEYIWLEWVANLNQSSNSIYCNARDITEKKMTEKILLDLNQNLELKVEERTAQLEATNKELESFTYSVSHDLRAPLRSINGFSDILLEDYSSVLDEEGKRYLQNVRSNATKMGNLIDDLLAFSRLGRQEVQMNNIDMNNLVKNVVSDLNMSMPNNANIKIADLNPAQGDYTLIYQVLINLISNAIKYSSKCNQPEIEISCQEKEGELIYYIRDNGVGFDMKYYNKLFGVFQRLHSTDEFEGTGVGLAIVNRIIKKHHGKVWAESVPNQSTTFYFSLNTNNNNGK